MQPLRFRKKNFIISSWYINDKFNYVHFIDYNFTQFVSKHFLSCNFARCMITQ